MSILKLTECLWEITTECDKGCEYCGSKKILNKKRLSPDELKQIARQLVAYKVSEVTLTGGEPGVFAHDDPDTFNEILGILTDGGVKVKAVTYGKLSENRNIHQNLFDVIGFSINTKEDISYFYDIRDEIYGGSGSHTMITNFGKHNIWEFDELARCAEEFSCWQIQLTMGAPYQLTADGIKHLREKISKFKPDTIPFHDSELVIALADNLQSCHKCMAGVSACSITYDGDVLACLSERSYGDYKSYGNLLKEDISEIWENKFKDIRFQCSRKCCRDFIEYPSEEGKNVVLPPIIGRNFPVDAPNQPRQYDMVLYGVSPSVFAYAVYKSPNNNWSDSGSGLSDDPGSTLMVYGVFNP